MEEIKLRMFRKRCIEYFIDQNIWENHDASQAICDYPDMYLLVGKKSDAYESFINPVINGIRNQDKCPLFLNVIIIDSSKGIEDFKSQIRNNLPDPTKINLYVIENFDETVYQGREKEREFTNSLCSLMGPLKHKNSPIKMNNSHIIIISDKTPRSSLDHFFHKSVMTQIIL